MNIRSLKTLAVAIPMALTVGSQKAAAQSQEIVKAADKILVADTLKAMDASSRDLRLLSLKKYNGHFKGSVVNGKIGNGQLEYAERGKTVPAAEFTSQKTNLKFDASLINGSELVGPGYRMHGAVEKGKNVYDVSGLYSTKSGTGRSTMSVDGSYTRVLPLGSGIDATGKLGASYTVQREAFQGGDHHGIFTPHLTSGLRYNHKFDNGIRVGASAEIGGAQKIFFKTDAGKTETKAALVAAGEVEAGYKNITAFANGGKDPIMGDNIAGGLRVRF